MRRYCMLDSVFAILIAVLPLYSLAETYALQDRMCQRNLRIIRHYDIITQQGKPYFADLPALMSFWGESNWQIVKASHFTYSEPPDKTETASDDFGQPRRYYRMTWNTAKANKITVEETLDVELTCFNTLYTAAKLPYAEAVLKRFTASLGPDEKEGINPKNLALVSICDSITKKSHSAEDAVEGVCDWINENIKFVKGQRSSEAVSAAANSWAGFVQTGSGEIGRMAGGGSIRTSGSIDMTIW